MDSIKLSQLNEDDEVYFVGGTPRTVSDLKAEISNGFKAEVYNWVVCQPKIWKANARDMIEDYIESIQKNNDMYEDWDHRAHDCFLNEDFEKIQTTLDEIFNRDKGVCNYWKNGDKVIIK
jgi:hypothetical protein